MYGIHQGNGLAGKSILVTGAANGIGRSSALLLADAGAYVTIGDIDEVGLAETVRMAEGFSGKITALRTDVSVEQDIVALVAGAVATYGRLDGAANVAGFPPTQKLLHEVDWQSWQRVISVNLGGVYFGMKHQIAQMLKQGGGGAIVNISSNSAIAGFPLVSDYAGAKAAIIASSRTAVQEYGRQGIRINCVLPGPTETRMLRLLLDATPDIDKHMMEVIPAGRTAHPDELGYAVRWLLSDEASYVNGTTLVVDGGHTS